MSFLANFGGPLQDRWQCQYELFAQHWRQLFFTFQWLFLAKPSLKHQQQHTIEDYSTELIFNIILLPCLKLSKSVYLSWKISRTTITLVKFIHPHEERGKYWVYGNPSMLSQAGRGWVVLAEILLPTTVAKTDTV